MQTENNEKQSKALRLADDATGQMDVINRYLRMNWLDDDYPDEKIYEALNDLRRLHAENAKLAQKASSVSAPAGILTDSYADFEAWYWESIGDENKPVREAAWEAWQALASIKQAPRGDAAMPVVAEIRNKTHELGTWVYWFEKCFSGDKLIRQADALAALAACDVQIKELQAQVNAPQQLRDVAERAHGLDRKESRSA